MKTRLLLVLLVALPTIVLHAQELSIDFQSPVPIRSAHILAVQAQADGKFVLGGDISFYGTRRVDNIIRINADGSLDDAFNFSHPGDYLVTQLTKHPAGGYVALVRGYSSFDLVYKEECRLLRISDGGAITKEITTRNNAWAMAVQADGKVLVTGDAPKPLIRYNTDFTPDVSFNDAVAIDGTVAGVTAAGGKIFISGPFSKVNGVTRNDVAKLNANGTLDNSFDPGTGTDDFIQGLTVQPDGKIILGHTYINSFNGLTGDGLMRLNANGSVDQSFNSPYLNGLVSNAYYTADGIYAAAFLQYNGGPKDYLFRMDFNGTLDPTFEPVLLDEFGAIGLPIGISGNTILVPETQEQANVYGVSKVSDTGSFITTFNPPISRFGTIRFGDILDGKLLIAGDFIRINGLETYGVARLNANGSVDPSFSLKENMGVVWQLDVLDNDNILVTTYRNLFKLNADGDRKPEFSWEHFENLYQIIKFKSLADGTIMVADANQVSRLTNTGSKDETFATSTHCCWTSTLFDFDVQGDKTIWGSEFESVSGVDAKRIVRFTNAGAVDQTFDVGEGADGNIGLIKVLDNNEILVGGFFDNFDGVGIPFGLTKLSPDGALVTTFNDHQLNNHVVPPAGIFFQPRVEQINDKIYIRSPYGIFVLNTDGSVDPDFSIPADIRAISDILVAPNENSGGRLKEDENFLFTLGSFDLSGHTDPVFMLKLKVNTDHAVTGIAQQFENSFEVTVFPQPVKETLKIKVKGITGSVVVHVHDLSGQETITTRLNIGEGQSPEISMKDFAPGFYILKVVSESGKSAYTKFLKTE